jgi:hypothetical protein
MNYNASLATSFDSEYELLYGTDATIMMRDAKGNQMAWMFKEVDSALLGWEVYARKDNFYKETGIALVLDGSKQQKLFRRGGGGRRGGIAATLLRAAGVSRQLSRSQRRGG